MNEKTYKVMSHGGAMSLTMGILVMVTGIVSGILLIVNGAKLLKQKYQVTI